nr:DegT/DnrJ/EryC1/StrS aminotransferase family protein [Calditrichia bacterium]
MSSVAQQNIQFIDLGAQQARIRERIETRIKAVLDHGSYIMGPEVRELEAALAAFVGVKHAISCSSGTDALLMALMAKGVGAGDVIFTTPFTFIATAEVIALLGAHTVFVDIDADTYNMSAAALETTIADYVKKHGSDKLKGVIPVDLFGQPADYDEIEAVATRYGMAVWEDAAQSFGATYKGKRSCSIGEMGCTSFFPAKPLGCYGDGGAVFTNDDQLAEKLVSIRVHGKGGHKYDNVRIGINGRLDTLQAAILLEKLAVFEEEIELRDQVAARYSAALAGRFVVPAVREDRTSVWAQYSILSENREA